MRICLTLDLIDSARFNPRLASKLNRVCASSPACFGPGREKFRALLLKLGGGPVRDPMEYDLSATFGLAPNDCSAERLMRLEWLSLRLGAGCSPGWSRGLFRPPDARYSAARRRSSSRSTSSWVAGGILMMRFVVVVVTIVVVIVMVSSPVAGSVCVSRVTTGLDVDVDVDLVCSTGAIDELLSDRGLRLGEAMDSLSSLEASELLVISCPGRLAFSKVWSSSLLDGPSL